MPFACLAVRAHFAALFDRTDSRRFIPCILVNGEFCLRIDDGRECAGVLVPRGGIGKARADAGLAGGGVIFCVGMSGLDA